MSAIKDFFKKKKLAAKFKVAGDGQKLGDASSAEQDAAAAASRQQRPAVERQHPSSSAQQAGAAALNRIASQQQTAEMEFKKNRQRALIKDQARKELENEKKVDEEINKLKEIYGDNQPKVMEAPSQLAAQGVFFRCPLIGEQVYPREEMKGKIKEFLYSQLEQERGLSAVLIIHTCNSPRERVQTAVDTLCKYIDNIVQNPTEEKFRKIRRNNKAFRERVASLEGTEEFLLDCGFQVKMLPGAEGADEEFWVLDESCDIEHMSMLQDSLKSCEPLTAELDRGLQVIAPGSGSGFGIGSLPPDFFVFTAEEAKKEQQSKSDNLEREMMLRTKAMREKEAGVGRRKYKYCLVRVRFPDGFMIQGTFAVHEYLSSVIKFVTDNLETPLPFILTDNATGSKLVNQENSLQELGLIPASLLNFSWEPEIERDLNLSGGTVSFLKTSLIQEWM